MNTHTALLAAALLALTACADSDPVDYTNVDCDTFCDGDVFCERYCGVHGGWDRSDLAQECTAYCHGEISDCMGACTDGRVAFRSRCERLAVIVDDETGRFGSGTCRARVDGEWGPESDAAGPGDCRPVLTVHDDGSCAISCGSLFDDMDPEAYEFLTVASVGSGNDDWFCR